MMTRTIFTFICLVFVCHNVAESRTVSMYDLKPATLIKSISKPAHGFGGNPIFMNCSKATDAFQLTNVLVAGCSGPPCPLIKGTNTSIEIDFVAAKEVANVTAKVYGQIAGVMVPFPLSNSDACTCGVTCPTKAGNSYKYKYSLPIASEYPSITLAVFWYLEGPSGKFFVWMLQSPSRTHNLPATSPSCKVSLSHFLFNQIKYVKHALSDIL